MKTEFLSSLVALGAMASFADTTIDWPLDFDAKVAARIAAWAPSDLKETVASSACCIPYVDCASAGYGSPAEPFDSVCQSVVESNVYTGLELQLPGMFLLFK